MKRIVLLLCVLSFSMFSVEAANPQDHFYSTTALNGRYEIVQSVCNKLYTFKIDKQTGKVWRHRYFHELGKSVPIWITTPRKNKYDDISYEVGINFQIFMGEAGTYLIDINNGRTWRFYDHKLTDSVVDEWIEMSNPE
ncbi:MAG: hypothetical protein IK005_07740 [Paludibacteraceae bacterium]|nr:hypothetical protein [Paludibacteraceae bacterium]